jgi:GT2 family glycosyltransferase
MSDAAISIVMPCYNRGHDLLRVLQAYDRQSGSPKFELIAVDDASSDQTFEILSNYRPECYELRALRQERKGGPGLARNAAIQASRAPLVAFVGDDTLPASDFVAGHIQAHREHPAPGAAILGKVAWPADIPVNSLMAFIDGIGGRQFGFYYMRDGQEYDFRHFYTSNVSLKADLLKSEKHWFDPDFSLAAFEDVDLAYRLSRRGLRILYLEKLVDYHYHYHTIWTFTRRQYNSGRMGAVFLRKHPELAVNPAFRPYFGRLARLLKRPNRLVDPLPAVVIQEMENMACRTASQNEWHTGEMIERLYGSVLDYFFYAGFIEEYVPTMALRRRAHSAHAILYLEPALARFERQQKMDAPGSI